MHSEIVFGLSANNNIGDAFRRFGIQDGSSEVLIVAVGRVGEDEQGGGGVERALEGKVDGTEVSWDGMDEWLRKVVDLDGVRKTYKLGSLGGKGGGGAKKKNINGVGAGDEQHEDEIQKKDKERKELERAVLGLMALRGAT